MITKLYGYVQKNWPRLLIVSCISLVLICVVFMLYWWLGRHSLSAFLMGLLLTVTLSVSILIFIRLRRQRLSAGFYDELQAQKDNMAGRQLEIALLKERMAAAVNALKATQHSTSLVGRWLQGKSALYLLPWYVLIGPSAAGKSTLLRHSGLDFPFSESDEEVQIKGFGGTRNCDWWFSDQAVMLDTAGRYTLGGDDHEEWFSFLNLLKRFRRRLPINGILVAISIEDILNSTPDELKRHVKIIRQRIDELYKRLGLEFPIYLFLTKCDLLTGFEAFFSNLNENERQQVCGVELLEKPNEKTIKEICQNSLLELYGKLSARRIKQLAYTQDKQKKLESYLFPEKFKASFDKLTQFVELLSQANPYQVSPKLCQVFFTSSTQGLNNKKSKSYFIKNALSNIVFFYKDKAKHSQHYYNNINLIKRLGLVASATLLILSLLLYGGAYAHNRALLKKDQRVLITFTRSLHTHSDITQKLISLSKLLNYYQEIENNKQDLGFFHRLGLYKADRFLPNLRALLIPQLRTSFFQPSVKLLEKKLHHYQHYWPAASPQQRKIIQPAYYQALKAYLALAYPQRLKLAGTSGYLSSLWMQQLPKSAQSQLRSAQVKALADFYLQGLVGKRIGLDYWQLDQSLVDKSRQQLRTLDLVSELYTQLLETGKNRFKAITLSNLLADNQRQALLHGRYTIPGIFTFHAWRTYVKPKINELLKHGIANDWVLNNKNTMNAFSKKQRQYLQQALTQRYFAEYKQHYLELLHHISLLPASSLQDAAQKLKMMADSKGPIAQLLFAVQRQLIVVDNVEIKPEQLQYFHVLKNIANELEKLSLLPNSSEQAQLYAADILSGQIDKAPLYTNYLAIISLASPFSDDAIKQALQFVRLIPVRFAWQSILQQASINIQKQWQSRVWNNYENSIANHYPFRLQGEDITLQGLERFFNPEHGDLWQFIHNDLAEFLQVTAKRWQQKQWLGLGIPFSRAFTQSLMQARLLTATMFDNTRGTLGFSYQVMPLPQTGISEINLQSAGQTERYSNGPQQWVDFVWPGKVQQQETQLSIVSSSDESLNSADFVGVWGIFHLLDKAAVKKVTATQYNYHWDIKGPQQSKSVSIAIRSDKPYSQFSQQLWHKFTLPKQIVSSKLMPGDEG